MKRIFKVLALLLAAAGAGAQAPLDTYVSEALASNIVLRDQQLGLEKSLLALRDARSLFLPTAGVEGQYALARGGRSIDIPIGDLLNPVYRTLNQMTGSDKFPGVQNASEQLLPNDFYDVRVRTSVPILNPGLKTNRDIRSEQVRLTAAGIDTYRRELVKEVKVAYYRLLQAAGAVDIYTNARALVQQNLQVQQSLLRNGKGLPAYVSRAESEKMTVEAQLRQAQTELENAQAYINFLRNKPLTDPVQRAEPELPAALPSGDDVSKREELKSLRIATSINERQLQLARSFRTPRLNAFMDVGAQGFRFKVNEKSPYVMGGINVQVPLFAGKRNLNAIRSAELDLKSAGLRGDALQQQLELAAFTGRNALRVATENLAAARQREAAAQQYFKLIDRGYTEGVNSFIEFLDARSQLTNAKLEASIQKYALLIAAANLERQTASYTLP
ncbi:MAG: TolC family protein [Chitinophagaceae bacterium]|nr:MAG: TolC family protein [Chitinophagaceae bacterium]